MGLRRGWKLPMIYPTESENTEAGSLSLFSSDALKFCSITLNISGSFLGAIKFPYNNWKAVARSFTLLLPFIPCMVDDSDAATKQFLPLNAFCKACIVRLPMPPTDSTTAALAALIYSSSLYKEVPPQLIQENSMASFL